MIMFVIFDGYAYTINFLIASDMYTVLEALTMVEKSGAIPKP
jgi:hypothetical protein